MEYRIEEREKGSDFHTPLEEMAREMRSGQLATLDDVDKFIFKPYFCIS